MRISYRIRKNDGDTTPTVRKTGLCTPSLRPAETGRRHRRACAIRCANTAFRRGKTDGRRQLARLRTPPGSVFRTSSSSPLAFRSDLAFSDVPLIALLILKSSHEIQRRQGRKDAYSMPFERQAIALNRHAEKQPQRLGSDGSTPTFSWPSPSAACTTWTIRPYPNAPKSLLYLPPAAFRSMIHTQRRRNSTVSDRFRRRCNILVRIPLGFILRTLSLPTAPYAIPSVIPFLLSLPVTPGNPREPGEAYALHLRTKISRSRFQQEAPPYASQTAQPVAIIWSASAPACRTNPRPPDERS